MMAALGSGETFGGKGATNKDAPLSFSAFDGHIIYLEGNKKMLPVGEHFYPHEQATTVIVYPSPGADNAPEQISERQDKPESW
jgi:hypothetical protein